MRDEDQGAVKCLSVNDGDQNLATFEAVLAGADVQILNARSGREACDLLLVHDVSLAIIDVQRPALDGLEVVRLMGGSERTRGVPIIVVTADPRDVSCMAEAHPESLVDFLLKPIEPEILKHKARTFLQLHRERQQLAESLRLHDELMRAVCHELRNPLQAILMTASVLGRTSREPETIKASERLRSSGNRISRIVDDLLDHSRARLEGGIPIAPQPADLRSMTERAIAALEASQPGRGRGITLKIDGETTGVWDPARLEQVLGHLLGHALRHSDDGTSPVGVTLAGSAHEVLLTVESEGVIPQERLPKMFEPSRSGDGFGPGLGLYIVQQIIFAHGGTIEVSSSDGRTTFVVRLRREAKPGRAST